MAKKIQPWKDQAVTLDEEVDLVDMLEGAVADSRLVFHRARIELAEHVPASTQLLLKCDPLEMEGAFAELLRNAAEALSRVQPAGDLVIVRIGVEDEDGDAAWAKIEVIDNGPGIPMAMRERIFDPQYTTKESGYHGYGLVGAKRRIESVRGTICVAGPESPGAIIHIRLPIRLERVTIEAEA
jgi:two-component system C4-dicarboxylate transport sensor histidine kinase DctB